MFRLAVVGEDNTRIDQLNKRDEKTGIG